MQNVFRSVFAKFGFLKTQEAKNFLAIDNVIKKLIYLLVFLLPIWFLSMTINTIDFNKQALMIFLVIITLILWLTKILNQGEINWKSGLLNVFLGVFLIICILSTIFSLRPYSSLVGQPNSLSGSLINILGFFALYLLIVNNFKTTKDVFSLLFTFLVSSTIVSVIGLLQIWKVFILPWEITKSVSFNTIGGVNSLGIFSVAILTILIGLLFVIKSKKMKTFLMILGLINFLIVLSLNYWILWIVLAIGIAIVLIFSLMRVVKQEQSMGLIALPLVILAISLIFIFFRLQLPLKPDLPIEVGLSHKGSIDIVKNIIKEKPILGSGPETFAFDYSKYKSKDINQTAFWNVVFSSPAAEMYSIVSALGILGLISFLSIIIFFIIRAVNNLIRNADQDNPLKKFLEISLFAGWFALLVGWFLYPQNITLMFVFWLLFSLYLAESSVFKEKSLNLRQSPKILLLATLSFVVAVVIIIGFFYLEGTRFVAEARYKKGLDLIQIDGDLENGLNKILSSSVVNPYEDRVQRILAQLFILKTSQDINSNDIPKEQKSGIVQNDIAYAINFGSQATRLFPKNVANWTTRGQVYTQAIGLVSGALEWAEKAYNEAIKLDPQNPFIYTELGKAYELAVDVAAEKDKPGYLQKAIDKFNQALELKSDYSAAHFELARIFAAQGKLTEAIKKMEITYSLNTNDASMAFQLGNLYYRAEKYTQAKAAFIRAVGISPDFANARYFLGLLYDRENNKEDAIDQFDRILQTNPNNEEIKQILANLKAGKPALGSTKLGPPEQPENIPIKQVPEEQNKESMP